MTTGRSRLLSLALGAWASVAFLVLWVGAAVNVLGGGRLAADAWAWLAGLADPAQFLVWVVLLPVAVALWASQAGVPAFVAGVIAVGLVLWTAVAWGGLARTMRRRPGS